MNTAVLERVRSRGYWRVHFRPLAPGGELAGPAKCVGIVERASVSLRGWDYPHVPSFNHAHDVAMLNDSVEAVTDSHRHKEYWRMFESSQFIHCRALQEDWADNDPWATGLIHDPLTVLGITMTTWLLAEVFEFLARLAGDGLYAEGVDVSISLHRTKGRKLWVDGPERAPLASERAADVDVITYKRQLRNEEVFDQKVRAAQVALHIFQRFRFMPPEAQILTLIEELYALNMGRG